MKPAARPASSTVFADEVRDAVQHLRMALAEVCSAVPGQPADRASQLASALDLDEGLAWKLLKVIRTSDPFEATRYVPGQSGAEIFLGAARQKRVAQEVIARASEAFAEFRRLISEHAGDRRSFDMMAAGQIQRDRVWADQIHRKGAFQHLSYLYGIQARTELRTYVLAPSPNSETYDVLAIRGFYGVRRIRESVPWRVSRVYAVDDAGEIRTTFDREPIDVDAAADPRGDGLPLVRAFCTSPMPEFRRVHRARGVDDYLLNDDRLGNAGQFTCVVGEILREAEPRYRDARHNVLSLNANLRTPCERLVMDVLIHRDLFSRYEPSAAIYCDAFMRDPSEPFQPWDRMPMDETITPLGGGIAAVFTRDVPRYTELLSIALGRAGWDSEAFNAHRLCLAYPPVPTTVTVVHPLPERP